MRHRECGDFERSEGTHGHDPSIALLSVRSLRYASSSLPGRRDGAGVVSGQGSRTAVAGLAGDRLSERGRLSEPQLEDD
jgi:hypothetical protein